MKKIKILIVICLFVVSGIYFCLNPSIHLKDKIPDDQKENKNTETNALDTSETYNLPPDYYWEESGYVAESKSIYIKFQNIPNLSISAYLLNHTQYAVFEQNHLINFEYLLFRSASRNQYYFPSYTDTWHLLFVNDLSSETISVTLTCTFNIAPPSNPVSTPTSSNSENSDSNSPKENTNAQVNIFSILILFLIIICVGVVIFALYHLCPFIYDVVKENRIEKKRAYNQYLKEKAAEEARVRKEKKEKAYKEYLEKKKTFNYDEYRNEEISKFSTISNSFNSFLQKENKNKLRLNEFYDLEIKSLYDEDRSSKPKTLELLLWIDKYLKKIKKIETTDGKYYVDSAKDAKKVLANYKSVDFSNLLVIYF